MINYTLDLRLFFEDDDGGGNGGDWMRLLRSPVIAVHNVPAREFALSGSDEKGRNDDSSRHRSC